MIVYLMAPGNNTMALLRKFLTAVESFYHPSNLGPWSTSLGGFLYKLIEQFTIRIQVGCSFPSFFFFFFFF